MAENYNEMTVEELEEELESRDLPKTGNKPDLVRRLQDNDRGGPAPDESDDDVQKVQVVPGPTTTPADVDPPQVLTEEQQEEKREAARAASPTKVVEGEIEAEGDAEVSGEAAFIGVDPIYQNFANHTDAPLLAQPDDDGNGDDARAAEDRALANAEASAETNARVGVHGRTTPRAENDEG